MSTLAALAVAVVFALGLAACGATTTTARAEAAAAATAGGGRQDDRAAAARDQDHALRGAGPAALQAKVKELCPDCKLIYANANQDPHKQQQQAEAAITKGADVLVLDAVDAESAVGRSSSSANQQNIPVIAYDRLIPDQDHRLLRVVRQRQAGPHPGADAAGQARLRPNGKSIVMVNGAPTDPSAGDYKKGAHQVFDKSGVKIAKEYDTPDWSPDKAQREMEQAITALGKDEFVGVYSANDGMAGGTIAAMKGAGIDPRRMPTTGGDSEAAAIQRILTGEQYSTIYLAIKQQAETSARARRRRGPGQDAPAGLVNAKVDNGAKQVPIRCCCDPIAVTKDNIKDTVIKDGFLTVDEICTGKYKDACKEAGIE